MKKHYLPVLILLLAVVIGCTTTNYSANEKGISEQATVVIKDYITVGIVTVHATETHRSSPFGFFKNIEGSKVTYASLMQEAARLEADDVINVRIDVKANYQVTPFDWLTGWERIYAYTGTALAIKYTEKIESQIREPILDGIPKYPERSGATRSW